MKHAVCVALIFYFLNFYMKVTCNITRSAYVGYSHVYKFIIIALLP